ncbi:VOC family protein [Hoeflea sp.]|uniref:VOC family protein n=1 Tax=Hoeflea sp. TaxID=1940281 RepID=UPI003B014D1B
MDTDKTGRIVWHDLFTPDTATAMSFYARVAGWRYVTEHATEFAWGGGERDFILALLEDEAGAGITDTPPGLTDGWIAYIEVDDVDLAITRAEALGGAIVRLPFDVAGVGRNGLLRDPLGALVGISMSRHTFPAPKRQFGCEIYWSANATFPGAFYSELFGWEVSPHDESSHSVLVRGPSGDPVAHVLNDVAAEPGCAWLPRIRTTALESSVKAALAGGGSVAGAAGDQAFALLRDPNGVGFALSNAP